MTNSKGIIFRPKNKLLAYNDLLHMESFSIEPIGKLKTSDVTLAAHMRWDDHINKTFCKPTGTLAQCRSLGGINIKLQIYHALLIPISITVSLYERRKRSITYIEY